jgi:peroxiredoxin
MESLRSIAQQRWARGVFQGALLLAVLLGVRSFTLRGVASGAAPPLAGRDLQGRLVSLDDFRGEPVVVHFWATWCEVCTVERGSIAALARSGRVVTVATDSGDAAVVRAKMEQAGVSFPVVIDASGAIAGAWGVTRFPTTFFLDRAQRVSTVESGYTTSLGLRARLLWAGL